VTRIYYKLRFSIKYCGHANFVSITVNFNVHLHLKAKAGVIGAVLTFLHVFSWLEQFKFTVISNPL